MLQGLEKESFFPILLLPEWDKIKKEVTPIGLKVEDRPDILYLYCRVSKKGLFTFACTYFFITSYEFKLQMSDDIDKHITAKIPMKMKDRIYIELCKITWKMVHVGHTTGIHLVRRMNHYRRIDNGWTVKKREYVLDNKFIVPYNAELLLKFGCHINVEYTCQTSSIKYLFKYVHKGNDRVIATL
ncbi:hypothetical protein Ahy_B08g090500 isoform B [Arachis hypogaea]|uniref:Uncharacterized protein n=1 Tax=Arachis hypogaea TaxID=3818 RepID=A0A444Y059_ARAHY|nr:hypothetical protein Ahy_B08g090500 isoform B [Arachis hypogaea]